MEHRRSGPDLVLSAIAVAIASAIPVGAGEAAAQSIVWESRGESRQDRLGMAADLFGDLDGDGQPEILAGAPGQGTFAATGYARVIGSATGAVLLQWTGLPVGDLFGATVASAGDTDGDGVGDAIVGAPQDDTAFANAGAVRLYSGATGLRLQEFLGPSALAYFGSDAAGPGDLDGDGRGDVVIPCSPVAKVFAYSGASGALLWQFVGGAGVGYLGAVDSVGDLDSDGVTDLVVGATNDHSLGTNRGAAYVLSGATGAVIWTLADSSQDGFGSQVSGGRDVDGDGVPDVLVSDPAYTTRYVGFNFRGAVWAFSGATGARIHKIVGTWDSQFLGSSLSECGDLNGDGCAEFAVGEQTFGAVLVYSGKTGGLYRTLDPAWGNSPLELAPDLDGDGTVDFLTADFTAAEASGGGSYAGVALCFSGSTAKTIRAHHGNSRRERLGGAVAVLHDVDGDGWRDVLVGSPSSDDMKDPPGFARLVSGRDGHELRRHDGATFGDLYGAAITAVPDVDGDSVPDYAIAAPHVWTGAVAVEIRSGASGALLRSIASNDIYTPYSSYGNALSAGMGPNGRVSLAVADRNASGSVDVYDATTGQLRFTTTGDTGLWAFGASVSWVGDVNGDGEGDWIAGAPETSNPGKSYDGSAILFSGATGAKLRRFNGVATYDRLGGTVSGIGDLDGDGVRDFLMGASASGTSGTGSVTGRSGASGALLFTLSGPFSGGGFGRSLAALGDVNRDGIDDFAVGSSEPGSVYREHVFVWSGRTRGLLADLEPSVAGDQFGQRIATAATELTVAVDPDRVPDLLVGAPDTFSGPLGNDFGNASLLRLDDLMLQLDPPSANAGDVVSVDTRGGPTGNVAGLFAVALDATPIGAFLAFGTFDTLGAWNLTGTVPPGLSGHTLTLRSYAIGWTGKVVDSQDATLVFQ